MSGTSIRSFRHLEHQILSIISGYIGRASWMKNLWLTDRTGQPPVLYWILHILFHLIILNPLFITIFRFYIWCILGKIWDFRRATLHHFYNIIILFVRINPQLQQEDYHHYLKRKTNKESSYIIGICRNQLQGWLQFRWPPS